MKKVLFDYKNLRSDVEIANRESKDGKTISGRLNECGLGDYILGNAREGSKRHFNAGKIDISQYEHCDEYGLLNPFRYNSLCGVFGLDAEKYKVKTRSIDNEQVAEKQEEAKEEVKTCTCNNELIAKIDELIMNINKLGNIQMQNMEYLKDIKDGIQTMNDKYNKPSAYIRR